MKTIFKLCLLFLICTLPNMLWASHIVTAEISHRMISSGRYAIRVQLLYSCGGTTNSQIFVDLKSNGNCPSQRVYLPLVPYSCHEIPSFCPGTTTNCTNAASTVFGAITCVYEDTVSLPTNCEYTITYSECCRGGVTNLMTFGDALNVFSYLNTAIANTSPQFLLPPETYLYRNVWNQMSVAAFEPDGDSLVYRLAQPVGANNTPIPFRGNATANNPIQNAVCKIDSVTGVMSVHCLMSEYIAYDVEVLEYRQNVLISTTRRASVLSLGMPTLDTMYIDSIQVLNPNTGTFTTNSDFILASCPNEQVSFRLYAHSSDTADVLRLDTNNSSITSGAHTIQHIYPTADSNSVIIEITLDSFQLRTMVAVITNNKCLIPNRISTTIRARGLANCASIEGHVWRDNAANCLPDVGELGLSSFIVEMRKGASVTYAATDSNGYYKAIVDTGTYQTRVFTPSLLWWLPCVDSVMVAVPTTGTNAVANHQVSPNASCALLYTDIATGVLRACLPNMHTLSYSNLGADTARNATATVTFDPQFIIDSASAPYTAVGNVYTFQLGDVPPPANQHTIHIYSHFDCDSVIRGATYCVDAYLRPDTLCSLVPNWDGVDINVEADCVGDSVIFVLKNVGNNMNAPQNYFVVEDDIIFRTGTFQLATNQTKRLAYLASATAYRLDAEQSAFHPWNTTASAWVEHCNQPTPIPNQPSYVQIFDDNDNEPWRANACDVAVGSYDPNDKQATPVGYGQGHYITPQQSLEYKIRFQNTGTDTAFTVVLKDTLSRYLDIGTLQMGASSHPYTWSLAGRELTIRFDNINLPDSGANELASHGFINFEIQQKTGNPSGAFILNRAGIYFDSNAPVITNYVYHMVAVYFIPYHLPTYIEELLIENVAIVIYPNPVENISTVQIIGDEVESATLDIIDMFGHIVQTYHINKQNKFTIYRNDLPQGIYAYRVWINNAYEHSGKIIVR